MLEPFFIFWYNVCANKILQRKAMSFLKNFVTICAAIFFIFLLMSLGAMSSQFNPTSTFNKVSKSSILNLELEGVIMDGKSVLEPIRDYAAEENIKGVLLQLNSPGGVVGPSQEIYAELMRIKNELKKPVVVVSSSMAASGGYYIASAGSKVVTNPGTLMGSIGVIMQFADLSELYSWAKIKPQSITSGALKDAGSESRPMTEEERVYFKEMIDEVQSQFIRDILANRKIAEHIVEKYTDGRIFTGETAVELGFADQIGTYSDAKKMIGEMTGLGDDPEMFTPPKKRPDIYEVIGEMKSGLVKVNPFEQRLKLLGKPLAIMPGYID